jgi:hypothetical protein
MRLTATKAVLSCVYQLDVRPPNIEARDVLLPKTQEFGNITDRVAQLIEMISDYRS